jgi:uncharacterized OB-fold protein
MTADNSAPDDEAMLAAYPNEVIDHDSKYQYRGFLEHRLVLNRCTACGQWNSLHTPSCPSCLSFELEHPEVSGRGTVYTLIKLHQGPIVPGVDYSKPYPVATVELVEQEGLRVTTPLVGPDLDSAEIGMAVELTWIEREGIPYPAFQALASAS